MQINKECTINLIIVYLSIFLFVALTLYSFKDIVINTEIYTLSIIIFPSIIATSLSFIDDKDCTNIQNNIFFTIAMFLLLPFMLITAPIKLSVDGFLNTKTLYLERLFCSMGISTSFFAFGIFLSIVAQR